jgi:tRNA U34 5-methylaminomethyl-2-thiouridine-forming methyltransferase MnmC
MKLIKTKDNSYTFYSEKYQESYHSVSGALEESFKKYVEPCRIKKGMNILDIGFGLGYNSGAAVQKAGRIRIIALEKDLDIIRQIPGVKVPYWFREAYSVIRKASRSLSYKDKNVELNILLGDARETIKNILAVKEGSRFDAAFLDPFSPAKNPELWTKEFLEEVYKRMKKQAVLATFSCAGIVRKNLKEVGFEVRDGPVVGRKTPGTIAIKSL